MFQMCEVKCFAIDDERLEHTLSKNLDINEVGHAVKDEDGLSVIGPGTPSMSRWHIWRGQSECVPESKRVKGTFARICLQLKIEK
jgi:hypothetical protein